MAEEDLPDSPIDDSDEDIQVQRNPPRMI